MVAICTRGYALSGPWTNGWGNLSVETTKNNLAGAVAVVRHCPPADHGLPRVAMGQTALGSRDLETCGRTGLAGGSLLDWKPCPMSFGRNVGAGASTRRRYRLRRTRPRGASVILCDVCRTLRTKRNSRPLMTLCSSRCLTYKDTIEQGNCVLVPTILFYRRD
ncbi:hypothetical protein FKP32DRAFT_899895 [Trametes sanguinea]|nr:hypothetical protein FKP32DRAFT_899895 [Trametes sanguinea]